MSVERVLSRKVSVSSALRATFVCVLARLCFVVLNAARWRYALALSKFRTLRKAVWLMSFNLRLS